MLVENSIILELKTVEYLSSEHRLQLFNYMRLMQIPFGMLIIFGPEGVDIERYVYNKETNRCKLVQKRKRYQMVVR